MTDLHEDLQAEVVWIKVPLDGKTAKRLMNLSDVCHNQAERIAASLLHDILKDDEEMHSPPGAPVGASLN